MDEANDLFDRVPPGIPIVSDMVGSVQGALTVVRSVIGIAIGVTALGNSVHVLKSGNDVVNPAATRKWLQEHDFAMDPDEAKRVYKQMKKYSAPSPNSTRKMQEELKEAKKIAKLRRTNSMPKKIKEK